MQKVEAVTNCSVSNTLLSQTAEEQTLLNLINSYRQQNGKAPLAWSATLKLAAAWMSNDMYTNSYASHTDSLGREFQTRLNECGYNGYTAIAENIYPNSSSPQSAFEAWKNSPAHNTNMLNASFTEAGMAVKGEYWTLDLGNGNTGTVVPTVNVQPPSHIQPTRGVTTGVTPRITPSITSIPSRVPTPSINLNPTNTRVKVVIKINGIGPSGNKVPKHLTRLTTVGVFDLDNKFVLSGNGFLKFNGNDAFEGVINLGQIADGIYYVKVSSINTLSTLVLPEFQRLSHASVNNLPFVILTQGDLNADNIIDIYDFNLALPCFQNKRCEDAKLIDFNDDGSADVIDYNLFLASFKRLEGD